MEQPGSRVPDDRRSGLKHANEILDDVDGVGFTFFTSRDVVRHPLVQRIVEAYDRMVAGTREVQTKDS